MTSGQGTEELPADQLVTFQRLANALLRPLTEAEKAAATDWVEDAWEEIRGRVPGLQARRDAGLVTDGQLRKVVTAMVVRVLRNPDAIRQWAVDDASFTRDSAQSAGELYLSDPEAALLGAPAAGGDSHLSLSMPYS